MEFESAAYEKVHNIIYGAIAFAEDYGFAPHEDFKLAQMILEEDTEAVPLIEYEFGVNGKPQLVVEPSEPKLPFYLNKLDKYAGEGNYEIVYMGFGDDDYIDDEEEYDDEESFFEHESYGPDEWEDFILEADPESLFLKRYECFYIYDKAILSTIPATNLAVSAASAMSEIEITYEPMENDQSEEETAAGQEIYDGLYAEDRSDRKVIQILNQIKSAIERWPQNPIFHNYLINAYMVLQQKKQQKEATLALVKQFPDYFFGKLTYAQLLIDMGDLDAVPKVFNNHYNLKAIFPEREVFHISEVVSFNTMMCLYFVKKDDFHSAYIYRKIIAEIELPEHFQNQNAKLFFGVEVAAIMEVKALVIEAQQDENKRKELVSALLQ